MSLKDTLKNYWERQKQKSAFAKVADILFIVFVVLLLIPSTRREIRTIITRTTMMQPRIKEKEAYTQLEKTDYQWQLKTYNGDVFTLGDLAGNVIFLNFWATWCSPCRAEMPAIQQLYNQFENDVVFVLVSNESRQTVEKYFAEEGYELPVYYPQTAIPEKIKSNTIPATYIISKSGQIVLEKKGAARWDGDNIKQLLYNLVSE
jgi:thiol-disulfide isomerase/thioredoxin